MSAVIERPSPNCDARPPGVAVAYLILHYTGMASAEAALARLCDPAAKVSAHYTIDEAGRIYAHVPEARRAWHAGRAHWRGETDLNARSVGIELVNPGHEFGYRPFPEPQMARLIALGREIAARYGLGPAAVLGHSDVAPTRKQDPGELFDWPRLAGAGLGLWPSTVPDTPTDLAEAQGLLGEIGYGLPRHGRLDPETEAVLVAFQRRYRPRRIDGRLDAETAGLIAGLHALLDRPVGKN